MRQFPLPLLFDDPEVPVGAPAPDQLMISDAIVQKAAQLVDLMGVLDQIQVWRNEERKGPGGRPETFPMRALIVAMVLCVTTGESLHVELMTNVLFIRISPAMRTMLGVPDPPGALDPRGRKACYRNVRTRIHTLIDLVDPSVLPKNRRLGPEAFEAAVALRGAIHSEADCALRRDRLTWLINQILEASFRMLPRAYRRKWKGSVAVDATVVEAFARPERRAPGNEKASKRAVLRYSADPDAAWYHREPDKRDPDATPKKDSVWGSELTIAVTGSDDPAEVAAIPSLAIGMAPLHRPSYEPGLNAIVALASVHARGHPANFLAADRAYTNAKAEKFQLPARALGYRLVLDYKIDQLGIQDSFAGFVQIEGWWYSPSIPAVLANATADYRNGVIDDELYRKRLEERWLYRARAKSHPDAEGHIRVSCPASCGMARCELEPASLTLAATRGKIRIPVRSDIRADPPLSCRQSSVTIPPVAGAKLAQELLFGSPEWGGVYGTLRNSIEGFNGYVKDGAHEALGDPGRRRLRGIAAQSVLVAFQLFAANLRKIAAFLAEEEAIAAGAMRRLPRRRRTLSIDTWKPGVPGSESATAPDPPRTV